MKKTIKTSLMLLLASATFFTSCTKDETLTPPTLTINDGVKTQDLEVTTASFSIKVVASAATDRKLTTVIIDKAVPGQATTTIKTWSPAKKDLSETYTDALSGQTVGQTYTYTIKATDDKDKVTSETVSITFISTENVIVSSSIQLGAQNNTTLVYKFLGIADNFTTYTAGASGTARANSAKIDFIYYYGTNDKNAFASPTNTDGAQVIWNKEINGDATATPPTSPWATKNDTKFKQTVLSANDFDGIMTSKKDDLFKAIDFSTSSTSKYTDLINNDVIAFLTASGKKGLIKFTSTATDNTGAVTLYVICQK